MVVLGGCSRVFELHDPFPLLHSQSIPLRVVVKWDGLEEIMPLLHRGLIHCIPEHMISDARSPQHWPDKGWHLVLFVQELGRHIDWA